MKRLFWTFLMTLAVSLSVSSPTYAQTAPRPKPVQIPPALPPRTDTQSVPVGRASFGVPYGGTTDNSVPVTILDGAPACDGNQPCSGGMGTFYGVVGLQIVKPYFESNQGYTISTVNTPAGGAVTQTANRNSDYTYDFDVTPRIILGWVNENGLGARIGWWLYDHNADSVRLQNSLRPGDAPGTNFVQILTPHLVGLPSSSLIAPGSREVWTLNNSIRFDVWDFQITQALDLGRVDLVLGGGVRYAHMNQSVNEAYTLENDPGLVRFGRYSAGRSFNGIGPTVFANTRVPLSTDMGLAFYSNLHLGALFGRSADEDYTLLQPLALRAGPAPLTITRNSNSRDSLLAFAEGEIGIEWLGRMGNLQPFVRLGLVGNVWHGVGNTQTPALPASSTFGFFGYSLLAGVNY